MYTNADLKISYVCWGSYKNYPENFAFLRLRILKSSLPVKIVFFLKNRLLFNPLTANVPII